MKLIVNNLIAAFAYFVGAYVGLLLALPPSNASPVWPPAGIALAMLLIFGNRVLPGLVIGAFAAQLYSFVDTSSINAVMRSMLIGFTIGLSSVLQAFVGKILIGRYVGPDNALVEDRKILTFLLMGGPVACTVAATVGVSTITIANIIKPDAYLLAWLTWWVGDSIGVLILTPMLLIFFGQPKEIWRQRIKTVFYPLFIFLILMAALFQFGKTQDIERMSLHYEQLISQLHTDINDSLTNLIIVGNELKALFTSTKRIISEEEFINFSEFQLQQNIAIQVLEWIPMVKDENRQAFENNWLGSDSIREPDDNQLMLPASQRPVYFPIRYLCPFDGNERALGFDVSTNPIAYAALQKARDSGKAAITGPLQLIQDQNNKVGAVVYTPVYSSFTVPENIADRRNQFLGVIASVFRVADSIENIIEGKKDIPINIRINDGADVLYERILDTERHDLALIDLTKQVILNVADREWLITYTPSLEYFQSYLYWHTWWLILIGMIITAMAGAGLLMITGRTLQTEELVKKRTKQLESEVAIRKQTEVSLVRTHLSLTTVSKCNEIIVRVTDEQKLLDEICNIIAQTQNYTLAVVAYVAHDANKTMPVMTCHGAGTDYLREARGSWGEGASGNGPWGQTVKTGQPYVANDLMSDPNCVPWLKFLEKHGFKSQVVLPLKEHEKVFAILAIYAPTVNAFDESEVKLLEGLADNLAFGINTIRSEAIRKEAEKLLSYQASHDALTGLINRREFERRLERLLSTVSDSGSEHSLCYMDLDHFKVVNDTCGHTAGDEMLRQLSSLLNNTVRKRDTIARLGGDEFGVLMEHCSLKDSQRTAKALLEAIQDFQFTWEQRVFKVGVSIGLVAISDNTLDISEILKQADIACYTAKDKGRNCIHVYRSEDMETTGRHGEMQWVVRINQAIEEDRFCLYAQPIVSLDNDEINYFEILLKMQEENKEIIQPGAFIPAAERYNLMPKIDRWVVNETLSLLTSNPGFLDKINFFSINLSGQSLIDNQFLDYIKAKFKEYKFNAKKICFEITETTAISNLGMATKFINSLKNQGCHFALDDFGSGISSYGYLKNLPVDYLKIDGIFVKDITNDPIDYAMVKSINDIGQLMGMQTIAEFVENDDIKNMLKEIGVNYVQGFGVGVPQPVDMLIKNSAKAVNN